MSGLNYFLFQTCALLLYRLFFLLILKYYEHFQVIIYYTHRLHHSRPVCCPSTMTLHCLIYYKLC